MKRIFVFCLFFSLFFMCDVWAKNSQKKPLHDYRPDLENVLVEDRLAFDPMIVEDTIKYYMAPFKYLYNAEVAAETYDEVAAKNDGYMSLTDLFYVCLRSFVNQPVNKWNACRRDFIEPLLIDSDELSFIDNAIIEAYDGHAFNQPCRPPETEPERTQGGLVYNAICTTGYYENIDPAFEKAMITKFRTEGGCAYVGDGNGKTCYGVGGKSHPEVYNKNFSRADAEKIAYKDYYTKHKVNLLPDAIRGDVFMAIWGTGNPIGSIKLLQEVLGIEQTGKIDDATISAAANYSNGNLRKKFLKARWNNMKNNGNFSNGWAKAFIVYLKNGCHTVPEKPLDRNEQTMAECNKMK